MTLPVNYTPYISGIGISPHDLIINFQHDARNYVYGYSEIPIVVDEDEEWNFPMKCYNDIVVKKGATLILSCRLEMVPQAKIIVEEGGTLIVDGATITSARCGGPDKEGLWRGIEVWGDINYSQTAIDADGNLRQGKIVVKNNALIEHAYVAIQANKSGSWVSGGGIILVDEAQIKNCWKGIHFSQYPNFVNISKITRTDFEINDEWKLPTKPIDFIQGWKFRGVEVSLCNFVNNHPVHPMNGIYVENAHIYVRGFKPNSVDVCDDTHESWKPNRFVNLRKGIEGVWLGGDAGAGIGFTPVVVKNVFVNCHRAIINKRMPNFTADANKIFIGHPSENYLIGIGIHQIGGVNYNIRENCIVQENENIEHICVGILVDNSGGDNNQIYKNHSHNVELAFLAQNRNKTNSTGQSHSGLQFLCNQNFGEQTYDFAVTAWRPNDPLVGIRYLQGGNGLANQSLFEVVDAGNTYTHTCDYVEADYHNGVVSPFIYYHYSPAIKIPECYTEENISLQLITQTPNQCPAKFKPVLPNGEALPWPYDFVSPWPTEDPLPWPDDIRHRGLRQIEEIEADFVVANTQFLAMAIVYNAVIDNGDPQSLLQYIYPTANVSAMDVRLALLDVSPNISKETIYALVEENTLLSNQDLLEIIAANPDLAHDEELLRMLQDKTNPMDEWMINFLRNMGTYTTDRTVLEWQFTGAVFRRQSLAWEMAMALAQQPNIDKPVYYSWLDAIGTTRALYQKAEDMASSGNYTGAQNVMQNIDVSRLDRWETDEYYAMQYWFTLLENLHNTNRNLKSLDSTELMALTVFASNYDLYGLAGVYAKNILNLYEPDSHFFDVVLPEQNRSHNRGESRVLKPLPNSAVITLFAYPNPTQQQATIFLNQKVEKGSIRVYNLQGNEVLQTNLQSTLYCVLDFESLPNGVYFVVLTDENNTKLAETKITVSK